MIPIAPAFRGERGDPTARAKGPARKVGMAINIWPSRLVELEPAAAPGFLGPLLISPCYAPASFCQSAFFPLHMNVVGMAKTIVLEGSMAARRPVLILLAALLAMPAPAWAADSYSSDWAAGLKSSARLIAAGSADGALQAGVEFKLAPGAITYWRNPGDAGLPPTLSFEGSDNLAQARISFPAPRRLAESGGGEAFGYDHGVVFPID